MSVVSSNILAGTSGQAAGSYEIKKGLRFNDSDGAVLTRTPSTAGNRRTWTYSCWFKRSAQGSSLYQHLIDANDGSTYFDVQIYPDGDIGVFYNVSGSQYVVPTALYRDFSAWYHFVLAVDTTQTIDSDRVKIYINGVQETSFSTANWPAQDAELMINSTAEHELGGRNGSQYFGGYMADSYLIDGSAVEASVFGEFDTDGIWQPKEVTEDTINAAKESQQPYETRDNMAQEWSGGSTTNVPSSPTSTYDWKNAFDGNLSGTSANAGSSGDYGLTFSSPIPITDSTTIVFHLRFSCTYVTVNSTQIDVTANYGTSGGTFSITGDRISESEITSISIPTTTSLAGISIGGRLLVDGPADNTKIWSANFTSSTGSFFSGQGPTLAFNGLTGAGQESNPSASSGTLTFTPSGGIAYASSIEVMVAAVGNRSVVINGGSPITVSTVDQYVTVATGSGTLNSLSVDGTASANWPALKAIRIDGKVLVDSPSQYNASKTWSKYLTSPAGFSSGRYPDRAFYGTDSSDFAATPANVSGESNAIEFTPPTTIAYTTLEVRGRGTDQTTFSVKIDTGSGYGSAITSTGDKWQTIATSGTLTKLKLWTTSFAGENEFGGIRIDGKVLVDGGWGTNGFHLPFDDATDIGKDATATAPTLDPRGGFEAVTYTGNGAFKQITGTEFRPDLVWIKARNYASNHVLYDTIRGTSQELNSNTTSASTDQSYHGLMSFNSDGFSVRDTNGGYGVNGSYNYAAWCWKAGGDAVSNSDGTVTSTVSADQNYGFSVVTYTGSGANASIGHGLNSALDFYIVKARTSSGYTDFWSVYHQNTGESAYLKLNDTAATTTGSSIWNNTAPTSNVFSVSSGSIANVNSVDYVAYCWSEVSGYSKFGTWTGTGVSGHKITTGFRPAFLLVKRTDTTGYWNIVDIERGGGNALHPNLSDAESVGGPWVTFNDDGFTLTTTGSGYNDSGATFIYAAFADYPGNNFTPHNLITEENTSAKNNFGAIRYTGTGVNHSITGLNFQPDLVWIKDRDAANHHYLVDSVRGVGTSEALFPDRNVVAGDGTQRVSSLDSNGFSLLGNYGYTNTNSYNYVAWCWKAGGTASSNTNGTITSSVSANPNFGFSIVSYTSDSSAAKTVGHGLSSAPRMIFFKDRDSATNWFVYHNDDSESIYENRMFEGLNTTAADSGSIANMNNTAPSSTVFSLASGGYAINPSGNKNMIAYCWSEVPGYSRFSSYVGNGSSTGPVIECGFKPAFILIKGASNATDWLIWDSARNLGYGALAANLSQGESWFGLTNTLSVTETGFQITTTNAVYNTSGATYIYAAFADPAIGDLDLVNDTPTANAADPVKGNYATLNTLDKGSNSTLSNGNLYVVKSGTTWASCGVRGTIGVTSGKYYWEITKNNDAQYSMFGVAEDTASFSDTYAAPVNAIWGYISNSGNKFNGSDGGSGASYGASFYAGDVIGVALDMDAGTLVFYKNGVSQGTAYTNLSGKTIFPWVQLYTDTDSAIFNFGQQPFKYTPPAGYKELCTTNLPDPTIEDGSKHFDVKLWDGNNADPRSITTSIGPDLVWIKTRNQTNWHSLTDSVRGAPNKLYANSTNAEDTAPIYGQIDSFSSDGFTLGGGTDATNPLSDSNQSGTSYVAWAWDAGTSNTSIGAGSLTSSLYNQNSTWSSNWTASGNGFGSQPPSNGFDADFNNYINNNAGGQYITWDTTSYTLSGTLQINCSSSSGVYDVYVNGVKASDTPSSRGWVNCGSFADINEIQFGGSSHNSTTGLGSAGILIYEIKVAGKTLVDSGVSISTPSIASTVRANPSAGFSIVSYTGTGSAATVAHGLNAAPEFIITKARSNATNWVTGHEGIGWGNFLFLDTTAAPGASAAVWNDTAPDSNVFSLASSSYINPSGSDVIAYCFTSVEGYSKIGTYEGNGTTDNAFVYCGFRPKFVLFRNTSTHGGDWMLLDTSRRPDGPTGGTLVANVNNAEDGYYTSSQVNFDFLSNGFKIRHTGSPGGDSGRIYIYLAIAENPFKQARAY